MFKNLIANLFADDRQQPLLDAEDAEIAIAALLVRIARADNHYEQSEKDRIDLVLARRRGLSQADAAARRHTAEAIEAEAPDTVRFTRQIKDRIALDDRAGVIAALWEVCYADLRRDADEETMIRLVASLLGVNDRDSALIRQRVLVDLGIEG